MKIEREHQVKTSFGLAMDGGRSELTAYRLPFNSTVSMSSLCTVSLTPTDIVKLREAVLNEWYVKFELDGLPAYAFLGRVANEQSVDQHDEALEALGVIQPVSRPAQLFTSYSFDISIHEDRVVEINVSADPDKVHHLGVRPKRERRKKTSSAAGGTGSAPILSAAEFEIHFTYTVRWKHAMDGASMSGSSRLDKYHKQALETHHMEIHWVSILSSCLTVLLLVAFLAVVLVRALRRDVDQYELGLRMTGGVGMEDAGWKLIARDVFRFPPHRNTFAALVGNGYQLLALAACLLVLSVLGHIHATNRAGMRMAVMVLYAFTSGMAGYQAAAYYRQLQGDKWVGNILLTCSIMAVPAFSVGIWNNTIAVFYGSIAALPVWAVALVILLWALVTVPLQVLGGIIGKNRHAKFAAPVATNKYAREIPPQPWFTQWYAQMGLGGLIPFASIYIELHYIFASIWTHKVYAVYSVLAIIFVMLLLTTAFVSIACTYFQLEAEDCRWWWRSFGLGAAVGGYFMGYATLWFFTHGQMSGLLQCSMYFGSNALFALALALILGTVAWRASLTFVRNIYRFVKAD